MSARQMDAEARAVGHWMGRVAEAATAFERRWTGRSLRRVDADLARRLDEQRSLFDKATIIGTEDEVETQGAAMCRGYAAAVRAMEASGAADDAYMLGWDAKTGFRIAIGEQRAAAERVAEVHGQQVVWVTPDELAAILAGLESFKALASIKRMFPGAEIVDRFPNEPAKEDA
jgi:hypothetical protein